MSLCSVGAGLEWTVEKRFSEWFHFDELMRRQHPRIMLALGAPIRVPKRVVLGSKFDSKVLESRRAAMEHYLQARCLRSPRSSRSSRPQPQQPRARSR